MKFKKDFFFLVILAVQGYSNLLANNFAEFWCPRGHFNIDQGKFVQKLAKVLKPIYILETGFCTGRSAISVLSSCDPIRFISVDINLDYMKPEGRVYAKLLQNNFPNFKVIEKDSKKLFFNSFFNENFPHGIDWLTVDGDHSYAGCFADLQVGKHLSTAGIIIIDDYKSGPPNGCTLDSVTNAVDDFCHDHPEFYKLEWNQLGKGFAILTKSQTVFALIKELINESNEN